MKNLLYIFTFIITTAVIAQSTNPLDLEKQKLKQAKLYGDKAVVANSMYAIIALEGPTSKYKDSLAYMYFNERNFVSCFLVTNDLLKTNQENVEILEMNAVSLETIGALDKAIEKYTTLLAKSNNNYHAYKIAGLQLATNKLNEALVAIKKADQITDKGTISVTFQVNKNYNQNVPLKPAIAYVQGLIELALEKKTDAKLSFERAVKLFPDFALAKSKLTTIDNQ
jgi:tetratricopeptide (TPR) repeat protein